MGEGVGETEESGAALTSLQSNSSNLALLRSPLSGRQVQRGRDGDREGKKNTKNQTKPKKASRGKSKTLSF